jgi:hypothetical protein
MLTAMNNCRDHPVGGDVILRGIANVKPTYPYIKQSRTVPLLVMLGGGRKKVAGKGSPQTLLGDQQWFA